MQLAQASQDTAKLIASLLEYTQRFADQNQEPAGGDCRGVIAAAQTFLAPTPADGRSIAYYPEMGESTPVRLFYAEHAYRSTYDLCWSHERDAEAREKLRILKIRPGSIRRREPGEWLPAARLGRDVFACQITSAAQRKLRDAGLLATRLMLD